MITDEMMKLVDEFENSICTNWELGSIDAGFLNRELKELRAAIEAAQAWRPIETAPKDGTPILVAHYGHEWDEAIWDDGGRNYWGKAGWYYTGYDLYTSYPCEPDVWMPKPVAPPAAHQDTTKETE